MAKILRLGFVLSIVLVSSVGAVEQTQEKQILHLTREIVWDQLGLKRTAPLPPVVQQQIRDLAKKLSVGTVPEKAFRQVLADAEEQEREESVLLGKIMGNIGKGVAICLALLCLSFVIKKIGQGVDKERKKAGAWVNSQLRSSPFVLVIPMASESVAKRVGRTLIEERLAARTDIFNYDFLSQDETAILVVNTVKGRLKKLQKRMKDLSFSGDYLSLPICSGQEDYLRWVADSADGRS